MQAPMLSCPLKQTNEIDWITPLKEYIRDSYGDDPERYAEECAMLNRLRQDMRGAGKDSASGRDLLYRYYGQLELLDLRFPVDENHIKISFTWYDAFTLKPTSQYSLAYEKASIIYNISAVLSCHAANQNRYEEHGLKTAYHSFQAAAGMFNYINENFLHAPSVDLSRDSVKTMINVMLAQAQEVFLERQINDKKKDGLLAKLASQSSFLYGQAMEGVQENVTKGIFERVWLLYSQIKHHHMGAVAQYYQALADNDANSHGTAICRLQVAEDLAGDAARIAATFPSSVPPNSNFTSETGQFLADICKKHLSNIKQKLQEFIKDNDFIYHQPVPAEAALTSIPKLPAAKPIPVSELYQGNEIQKIIGPDIFQRIVPMAVTESASMYDEEKAKLVRAEAERVEVANDEMATSFDYLKLPGSLEVLKGVKEQDISVDAEFSRWCEELAGHAPFNDAFEELDAQKVLISKALDDTSARLDQEESVCEKMRSKYGDDWTQQPSSRLSNTMRTDVRNYRAAVEEAGANDSRLYSTFRASETDFEEMRSAGETDEADVLYKRAMIKAGASKGKPGGGSEANLLDEDFEGGPSVAEQIANIEDIMKRLKLIKKEREQVLKDLKEKVHNDDISNVLILNKKSITSQDSAIFKAELEKFRPHQNRILQAVHKQNSLLKELTRSYDSLLQDKRVRSEQSKYEAFNKQRATVSAKYRKVYSSFNDLVTGLSRAQGFYAEMKDTVDSLNKNVVTFVENRRNEGATILQSIESKPGLVGWERESLNQMMEKMSVDPNRGSPQQPQGGIGVGQQQPGQSSRYRQQGPPPPINVGGTTSHQSYVPGQQQPPATATGAYYPGYRPGRDSVQPSVQQQPPQTAQAASFSPAPYNPNTYTQNTHPMQSPPPTAPLFSQHMNHPTSFYGGSGPAVPQTAGLPSVGGPNSMSMRPSFQQPLASPGLPGGGLYSPPPSQLAPQFQNQYTGGRQSVHQAQQPGGNPPAGWQPPPPPPGPPPASQGGGGGNKDPWDGLSQWR